MIYVSPIDGHVHLRGEEYSDVSPSFAIRGIVDARDVGLAGLVEEPNTIPYLDCTQRIKNRIEEIDKYRGEIQHGIAVALTPSSEQRTGAFNLMRRDPRVPSGKVFFVRSTGSGEIEITEYCDQKKMWEQAAKELSENSVIEGHYEDGSLFKEEFDYKNPISHSLRQNPEAEVAQFERQFGFAYDAGFRGTMLIKHVSNPETINYGEKLSSKYNPKFNIMYETTWHHMFLNHEDYGVHGNRVKMNPPLRSKEMQEDLLEAVLAGRTHLIGTDHAPHPLRDKDSENPKSGIPAILFYPKGMELLEKFGMSFEDRTRLTFDMPNKIYFDGRIRGKVIDVSYCPEKFIERYGWNPFSKFGSSL